MSESVAEILVRFARIDAVVLAAFGLFLIFLDINVPTDPSALRRQLAAMWLALWRESPAKIPGLVLSATMRQLDRFVVYWFEQSERNVATAGIFTLIVFIAIPIAALLNWLRGGSAFLLIFLLCCLGGAVLLGILSETKRASGVTKAVSAAMFASVFLFVPIYVFTSLTHRALAMPIGHGVLASLLLTPLLYLICQSAILLGAGTVAAPTTSSKATNVRRLATLFAAALPFAYLGSFGVLVIWHLVEPDYPVPSNWRFLSVSMIAGAGSTAMAIHLASPPLRGEVRAGWVAARLAAGLVIALGLACAIALLGNLPPVGASILAALPMAAPCILIGLIVTALGIKLVLDILVALSGGGAISTRPYRVTGVLVLLVAAAAGWASVAL